MQFVEFSHDVRLEQRLDFQFSGPVPIQEKEEASGCVDYVRIIKMLAQRVELRHTRDSVKDVIFQILFSNLRHMIIVGRKGKECKEHEENVAYGPCAPTYPHKKPKNYLKKEEEEEEEEEIYI